MSLHELLRGMIARGASDLHLKVDSPPRFRVNGELVTPKGEKLTEEDIWALLAGVLDERERARFEAEQDIDVLYLAAAVGRFRVNVSRQMRSTAVVMRHVPTAVPSIQELGLPPVIEELAGLPRGLVLVTGTTGSGKSTSLAAMIDHRNSTSAGHIITVEDPVEYVHVSKKSLVTHREVGVDTKSWHHALKNTLRQAPDVILIGEIRDAETMEHAIAFAETGHLCLGTLHANSSNQTIERIINFFPEERRNQLLMDLSANLRSIISQRLIRTQDGKGRCAAVEILINTPTIAERIFKGEFHEIKGIMAKSRELGMRTFDWALFDLYTRGLISYEEAIRNADSANELRLNIKLKSERGEPPQAAAMGFSLQQDPSPEEVEAIRMQELMRQKQKKQQMSVAAE